MNQQAGQAKGIETLAAGSVPPVADAAGKTEKRQPPANPATNDQKISLFLYLLVATCLLLVMTYHTIERFNRAAIVETSVDWTLPVGMHLKVGPDSFHYDAQSKTLRHRGALDLQRHLQLRDLLELDVANASRATEDSLVGNLAQSASSAPTSSALRSDNALASSSASTSAAVSGAASAAHDPSSSRIAMTPEGVQATQRSYYAAIDALAYLSNGRQVVQVQLLLLLGVLGGALGAILRSLVDFVGNACYTGQLDLHQWWPLYATRPLVGAILGFILVVLLKAKLLTTANVLPGDDSFWWLGIAIIGGFSTVDVTLRLRLAAKALFGVESAEKKS